MTDKNQDIMNQILRGEHMAVDIYDTFIYRLPEGELRDSLKSIQSDHQSHAKKLEQFITEHGGKPVSSGGLVGTMADLKGRMQTAIHPDALDMLRQLYDGEDKGLARSVQYSEHELGQDAKELLAEIFADDHDHLKVLKQFITQYEQ